MKSLTIVLLALLLTPGAFAGGKGQDQDQNPENETFYRIDCRYHLKEDSNLSVLELGKQQDSDRDSFCYGSAVYRKEDKEFRDVHLAIGCDGRTLFNDDARVHPEMTLDRLQPDIAATPAIEVFPHGGLLSEGTYTSMLDISLGRFKGLCYVHRVESESVPN